MSHNPHPFLDAADDAPNGVFVGGELELLGMPQGLRRIEPPKIYGAGAAGRAILAEVAAALRDLGDNGVAARFEMDRLSADDVAGVLDLLGEGEVSALIADAEGLIQAQESVFPGVWVMQREDSSAPPWLEAADAPQAARESLAAMPQRALPLEHIVPPDGTMNVMGVLTELRHRSQTWTPAIPTHVMNFTLLPMTPADAEFLSALLGQGPVRFTSGGYGSARIISTALRHVFAVQYLNAMGQVILDTVEIGDLPAAACAQREDFQDSAARLSRLLEGGYA
jgi:hydrogenase-1 operon protein HyaF